MLIWLGTVQDIKIMTAYIYIVVHLILGFLFLWLSHYRIKEFGSIDFFWLTTLETANLVIGVFWGNWGWDNFKKLQEDSHLFLSTFFGSFLGSGLIVVIGSASYYLSLSEDELSQFNIFKNAYFFIFSNITVCSLIVVAWINVTNYNSRRS
ncbi:TPA: hypothetical protein NGR42_004516 [Vibrio parahaemolyticus]|uniref:hypothetical protein n=2 Tax=Vibrio parahaemolyticus TaxID=670 RepID=UPI0004A4C7E2|nr:hypothetical protein [Vibrio parahaemolyticus]EGQ8195852.1 hypothetical protein [Vibrio parahaemolyticus]EGR2724495.1 hypothetical protein [Vibrio parahaemolyticus]EJE4170890.1 hypothetical protein [Vibrio parahaemolyticus]MCQ9044427.1 hypothetical protein [Vibrio parahaemolyticus]MCX8905790.1 hypothetical protein [Vibrio parahaemolyticus]